MRLRRKSRDKEKNARGAQDYSEDDKGSERKETYDANSVYLQDFCVVNTVFLSSHDSCCEWGIDYGQDSLILYFFISLLHTQRRFSFPLILQQEQNRQEKIRDQNLERQFSCEAKQKIIIQRNRRRRKRRSSSCSCSVGGKNDITRESCET